MYHSSGLIDWHIAKPFSECLILSTVNNEDITGSLTTTE